MTENKLIRICARPAGVDVAPEWFQNRSAGSNVACIDLDNASDGVCYPDPTDFFREHLVREGSSHNARHGCDDSKIHEYTKGYLGLPANLELAEQKGRKRSAD